MKRNCVVMKLVKRNILSGLTAILLSAFAFTPANAQVPNFPVGSGPGLGRGNAISVDSINVHIAFYDSGDTVLSLPPGEVAVRYLTFPLAIACPAIPCEFTAPIPVTVDVLTVPPGLIPPQAISVAVDAQGNPHIIYQDGQGGLKHATTLQGGWSLETVATSGAGVYNSVAIDKNGNLHVAYGSLTYATKSTGVWVSETVLTVKNLSGLSIGVDSLAVPQIAWGQHTPTDEVMYARRTNGQWAGNFETVSSLDAFWVSLALDKSDTPSVSYLGWNGGSSALTGELDYATRVPGPFWSAELVDFINFPCCLTNPFDDNMTALALSPLGAPRISYGSDAGVKFARKDSGVWTNQVIDGSANDAINFTSLAVDANDNAHMLYRAAQAAPCSPCNVALEYLRIPSINTPVGTNIIVSPTDAATNSSPVTLTFSQVTQAGSTSLSITSGGPVSPTGFSLGSPPAYYNLSTTALYSGTIQVCVNYSGIVFSSTPALFHFENSAWTNVTTSFDAVNQVICGVVISLSPFAVFAPQTITKNPTSIGLSSSANPSIFGKNVTFTASVTASGSSTPTGAVTFLDGSIPLASIVPLIGGTATFSTGALTVGIHSFSVSYGGDASDASSTSSLLAQTVNPAPLTITANNTSRQYGQANPAFTASDSGFVNGDGPSALSGTPLCTSPATPSSPVGSYTINCAGVSSSNYAITFALGTLTITPAPLMIAAGSASRPYGANHPAVIGTVTGLVNGDVITATNSTSATPASPVGNYAIVPLAVGAANVLNNYAISLLNGTLTVLPETTSLTVTLSPTSIVVGQSSTATITLVASDVVTMIDPSALAAIALTSSVASDVLFNNGICTPVPNSTAGTASCVISITSAVPNGRTLTATFAGSADLIISTATAQLMVTEPVQGQQSCIQSDFRNVAVGGGNSIWFNSIFRVRDVSKQKVNIAFANSTVQFQYTYANGNLVSMNLPLPNANIVIDPNVSVASTSFDAVNNVWNTTLPWDLDDNAFLSGMPWLVPAGGIPADVEPVTWCGTFAVDVTGAHIGWRWAAAAYSSFGSDGTTLGVKPNDTDFDNQAANHERAGTPENYEQFVIPGARGKGGRNYTGSYSRSNQIE